MTSTIDNILWVGDVREQFSELEARHLKNNIDKALSFLKTCSDYSSKESQDCINYLRKATRPVSIRKVVGDYFAKEGYAEIFVKIWQALLHRFTTLEEPTVNKMVFLTRAVALVSPDLCLSMGKSGALSLLLNHLRAPNITVDQLDNELVLNYVLPALLIIQSAIYLCRDNREVYRKAHAISILSPYIQRLQPSDHELNKRLVKLGALLTLSYILNESETERLDSADVKLCLTFLSLIHAKDASTQESMAKTGVSKAMILDGVNHVAQLNDANKINFVQVGMVALLSKILKKKDQFTGEEQVLAARGLWTLSFAEKNKEILRNNTDIIADLKRISQGDNKYLRGICEAALWEIFEGNVEFLAIRDESPVTYNTKDDKTQAKSVPSLLEVLGGTASNAAEKGARDDSRQKRGIKVMISYQWDVQKNMIQLKDKLSQTSKFNVWMDVDKMKGSILASMADAVEKSDVILVCLSRKYKESLNCRTEASYAYKLKKPLIPLMVEDNYDPDGWLGALVGVELYYNLCDEDQLTTEFPVITKAIEDKCFNIREPTTVNNELNEQSHVSPLAPIPVSLATSDPVTTWSTERVARWLDENDLSDLKRKFCRIKGKHLKQMHKRYQRSPDVFDTTLKTDLQMDFITILILTTALEELFTCS